MKNKKNIKVPLISVIVPVFNQEKWIGRCLRSLLNQKIDRSDYEIIVVDDGSDDRTDYGLNLFIDEIVLIKNEINLGLPASLNRAIKMSRANHIVRVDSDDYVNEHFLPLLNNFMEQNKYMDAVACDYFLVGDDEEIIARKNCLTDPIGCGIIFKSSHLFDIGLYDEEFKLWEEKELRYRFEQKYQIHRLELPLYRYRRHQKNITNDEKSDIYYTKKLNNKHKL